MFPPIRSLTSVSIVALSLAAVGCNGTTEDDAPGPGAGTAGNTAVGGGGMTNAAGGMSSTSGGMTNAGRGATNAGSGSTVGGQGAGGSAGTAPGGAGTSGDAGSMNRAGAGGAGPSAGAGGRSAGGAAGSKAGGSGGSGGMTPGLDACPMPPAEAPDTAVTALNTENTLRLAMGLDCAVIALPLCQSSQAHCDYYTQNQGTMCEADSPHDEISGCPGFTGAGLGDRFKAAGYTLNGSGSECMAFLDDPVASVMTFVNSVYHRTSILDPWMRDFGYGHSDGCDTIDFGTGAKSDKTITAFYPYADQTGLPTSFDGSREGPEPPTPPSGWPSGYPVTLYAQGFTATSHVITIDGSTDAIAHEWLDDSDPTLPSYAKCLYPDAPMMANTTYHVTISGTIGSTATTFDWKFTTGAATGGGRPRQ